ncbi:TPA: hypothetical protein MPW84_002755 [Listeria monocytogenes]|uniref:Uncharacterized protein n=6 Tax=Listeria TaxID=1637 RepID=A0A3T2GWT4_LISMN|nr:MULTISPECIES: hypothetical protein [Listeria]EAE3702107.1 hypothetical protein [Listeria monocytogenes serotype 1/2c]EAF3066680.1 hypothetical protein [Listeria monocytogenes serotype 1/2a]AEO26672.1 Lj965 prophage protein [Listeria monocytogenes FSL R2-561]AQP58393.1 hypothetical protein B0X32_03235 [Listeria monocytogenes]ARJ79093.1 hypothetical protein UL92_12355 [Listeria monocytogenes]
MEKEGLKELQYDLNYLDDNEVQQLIKSIKILKQEIPVEMPEFGKIKDDTITLGVYDDIEYKLHRYRHPYDSQRFSIHLRFVNNNEHLIRIDINNGTHRNPDNTIVQQNHIHIYKNSDYPKDAYAYPLPSEINDLYSIFTALEQFLVYNNIK